MSLDNVRKLSQRLKLPPLMGNLREVKEAELIRYQKLKELPLFEENWDIFLSELDARFLSEDCLRQLKLSDDAQFWLDNKELDFWELLEFFY
jgi:hypothetical protein